MDEVYASALEAGGQAGVQVFKELLVKERARGRELSSAVETWTALGVMEVRNGLVVMKDFHRHRRMRGGKGEGEEGPLKEGRKRAE